MERRRTKRLRRNAQRNGRRLEPATEDDDWNSPRKTAARTCNRTTTGTRHGRRRPERATGRRRELQRKTATRTRNGTDATGPRNGTDDDPDSQRHGRRSTGRQQRRRRDRRGLGRYPGQVTIPAGGMLAGKNATGNHKNATKVSQIHHHLARIRGAGVSGSDRLDRGGVPTGRSSSSRSPSCPTPARDRTGPNRNTARIVDRGRGADPGVLRLHPHGTGPVVHDPGFWIDGPVEQVCPPGVSLNLCLTSAWPTAGRAA
jgi:hypothetical protein